MQAVLTIAAKALSAAKGPLDQAHGTQTMVAGAAALAAYAAVAVWALRRFGTAKGAAVSSVAWIVVAVGLYPVVSR